jgi:hypothetical protein
VFPVATIDRGEYTRSGFLSCFFLGGMCSAKGAGSFQRGATPQGKVILPKTSAENANQRVAFALIPNMAFVEFDAVFAQKVAILLLKTSSAMVRFLALHVFENSMKLTGGLLRMRRSRAASRSHGISNPTP